MQPWGCPGTAAVGLMLSMTWPADVYRVSSTSRFYRLSAPQSVTTLTEMLRAPTCAEIRNQSAESIMPMVPGVATPLVRGMALVRLSPLSPW